MLFNISKSRLFRHLIAITLALLICSALYTSVMNYRDDELYSGRYISSLGHGKVASQNLITIHGALEDGNTIVVLGSSELTSSDLAYIPYHFLPKSLHIPVLAYGHAHFQSFAIEGLLRANADALSGKTKLVIMVSPGWFGISDLPLDSFLEHFQPQVLRSLYHDDTAKHKISEYLQLHIKEFGTVSKYQKAFIDQDYRKSQVLYALLNDRLFNFKLQLDLFLSNLRKMHRSKHAPLPEIPQKNQWNDYEKRARIEEINHMTNNKHWVRDDYYQKYLSDLPIDGTNYFRTTLAPGPELKNLIDALQFLKEKDVHALVVMQPLNPYVYKDAKLIQPIARELASICKQTGMHYFDMSQDEYVPGTMRDGMHLGELGWVRVDHEIVKYLAQQ